MPKKSKITFTLNWKDDAYKGFATDIKSLLDLCVGINRDGAIAKTKDELQGKPSVAMFPWALMLYEITQAEFLRGFKKLISQEEFYEYELSGDMESYDTELSTVIMENGMPIGLFLVRQDSDGCLVPLFLKAGDSNSSIFIRLLYESLQAALAKYGKQATVRITLRSSQGTKLLGALFPDFSPFIVRRGYFYV